MLNQHTPPQFRLIQRPLCKVLIPFQILSFRINGKECDFYWQGKKLLAELPKKSRNPWKVELIGFVKSGKLYYETMDLPEKQ